MSYVPRDQVPDDVIERVVQAVLAKADSRSSHPTRMMEADELMEAIKEQALRNNPKTARRVIEQFETGEMDEVVEDMRALFKKATSSINQLIQAEEESLEAYRHEMQVLALAGAKNSDKYKELEAKAAEQEKRANDLIKSRANYRWENTSIENKSEERAYRIQKYKDTEKKLIEERDLRLAEAQKETDLIKRKKREDIIKEDFAAGISSAKAELGDMGGFSSALKDGLFGSLMGEGPGIQETMLSQLSLLGPEVAAGIEIAEKVLSVVSSINKVVSQGVEMAANMATQYLGSIDARLAGNKDNITYTVIQEWMSDNFAVNPFVSQEKLMQNIASIVESGIAYNVEERAVIETIKDKMVATFDVLDSSLTRLIRLQQADLTSTQLGAEAGLTELLNGVFSDTSYLSDMYDSVSSAILDATAQFSFSDATAYNYNVQKWLAALYSVGLSDSAVSTIAQGINYLTTGDVTSFTGNEELTTLFGLAAKNANLSISDMFVNGLNATGVNDLMKSMITYLQGILENTGNQVVKSAWGGITNLSVSDLRAIQNLTASDINTIYNSNMDYAAASNKFNYELAQINDRTSVAEYVSNMKSNALLTIGNNLIGNGDNLLPYLAYTIGGDIGGLAGEAIQTLLGGVALVKSAGDLLRDVISDIGNGDTISGAFAGWESTLSRGGNYKGIASGVSSSLGLGGKGSGPDSALTGTSSDSYGYFAQAAESAQAAASVSASVAPEEKTASDLYKSLFEDNNSTPLKIKVVEFDEELKRQLRDDLIKDFHMESGGYFEEIRNVLINGEVSVVAAASSGAYDLSGVASTISNVRNS